MSTEPASDALGRVSIRIVSWNCNMALSRKSQRLLALQPDIAVVQECGPKDELDGLARVGWTGRSASKGLAVFAASDLGASVAVDIWDPSREWFLPVRIPVLGLDLLAAWAMNHRGHEDRPKKGRTSAAVDHYGDFLSSGRAFMVGDFNDNVTWDTKRWPVFADLTTQLAGINLVNLYHAITGEKPGQESRGSLYFYRDPMRPYLIDHVFLPRQWLPRVLRFEVGQPEDWLDLSDHVPITVEFLLEPGHATG